MNQFITDITPALMSLLSVVVTALIGWIAAEVTRRTGIAFKAEWRTTLHSALMTGANMALAKQLTGKAAIDLILSHVTGAGAGEAVQKLEVKRDKLIDMAQGALEVAARDELTAQLNKAIRGRT